MLNWKKSLQAGLLATTVVFASLLSGCGDVNHKDQASTQASYPVAWSETFDGKNYDFSVKQAPTHAISLSQATTEMMLTLGLEKHMVGTAFKEEEIYPPLQKAYEAVPVLSEKWPSYEVFMAQKPDFVTGWPVPFSKRWVEGEKIAAANVQIWIPESMQSTKADLAMNFQDMITLGKIFGVEDKAQAWVKDQEKQLDAIKEKIAKLPHKRVFIYDSEDDQPFTAFEGYTTNILRLIGADNVMSGLGVDKTWAKGSWETVVQQNPDYIIIADYGVSIRNDDDFQAKIAKIKANPQLQNITAVKENHFIRVKLSEITPGVRTVEALKRLAEEIHGIKIS